MSYHQDTSTKIPIIFRAIDVGFVNPTIIYQCVEINGRWELKEEIVFKEATIDEIGSYLKHDAIAPHKAVMIPDGYLDVKDRLRHLGIKVT